MIFKKFRTSFTFRVLSVYLTLSLLFPPGTLYRAYALTGGPAQPEFNSFTPIGTSDMVNLSTGDFNYNIPIMDVGGYPINLAYNSGVTVDQEASWVGLGWNLNVGQLNRNVRGLPDDFNGDEMRYENELKNNYTIGSSFGVRKSFVGYDISGLNVGMGVQYNNYHGFTSNPSVGVTFDLSKNVSAGMNISATTAGGATVSPSLNFNNFIKGNHAKSTTSFAAGGSIGVTYNSRQAISSLNMSASMKTEDKMSAINAILNPEFSSSATNTGLGSGSISFNDYMNFTPTKRIGMRHGNFTFSGSVDVEIGPTQVKFHTAAFGSYSKIADLEKNKLVPAYGYENTFNNHLDAANGILDFNREKDRNVSKQTRVLPITNYTYDIYSINGQGVGGMFKPFHSQVGSVYDPIVSDTGLGGNIGLEFGTGWNVNTGFDYAFVSSNSYTSNWISRNPALSTFKKVSSSNIDFEETYYKKIGDMRVDAESFLDSNALFIDKLGAYKPIKIGIGGSEWERRTNKKYRVKETISSGVPTYSSISLGSSIKRNKRDLRNQNIQKITRDEVVDYGLEGFVNTPYENANIGHHTAAYKVLQNDGSTYYFGNAVYNTSKIEATFDVSGRAQSSTVDDDDFQNGTITYNGSVKGNHSGGLVGSDQFLNRITTPAYAYTYLLTSILSNDYADVDAVAGPSDGDLGSYTRFTYDEPYEYKWRVPYRQNKVMFNDGLYSLDNDQKANYNYGIKQMQYIKEIETKTHRAIFYLSPRQDARGVTGEPGGSGGAASQKLDRIELFAKGDPVPIKTAYFEYNYSLCPEVPNSESDEAGKLTLERVYFTYKNSKMGMHTPYEFHYNDESNPAYSPKAYDVWGNYKNNDSATGGGPNAPITTAEFPYVEQDKELADSNTTAWSLSSIDLPSGGKIDLELESDDYQYVQDKKAMRMYKVAGVGVSTNSFSDSNVLYNGISHKDIIYVEVDEGDTKEKLIGNLEKEVYFKFLLNMHTASTDLSDYVSGYFEIDSVYPVFTDSGKFYLPIKVKKLGNEGGWVEGSHDVNPISKAGWYFGRTYLNRVVYSGSGDPTNDDFESIVVDLITSLGTLSAIFQGPNSKLEQMGCARTFIKEKSWIRLMNPKDRKYGGGSRVKSVVMYDNWDKMSGHTDNDLYKQRYGQTYDYNLSDGSSSGVATFEPNASKENPFVTPFYDADPEKRRDKIAAPKESNYVERPIGSSFFPGAMVTYSYVTVKNLERIEYADDDEETVTRQVKKHATGKVVHEFYTTKNFPTKTDYTDVFPEGDDSPYYDKTSSLGTILNIYVRTHMTMSQGFVVHTNDMNGKSKSTRVYAEDNIVPISGVDYNYSIDENGELNNKLPTINEKGEIQEVTIGEHYDVINDFRESFSSTSKGGAAVNFEGFVIPFWFLTIVFPIPKIAYHEDKLNLATTTKIINTTAILKEKIAYDLGSSVSTENLAWDATTGSVIVTKTENEYDDAYYTLNYPAHWYYQNMGLASQNIDIQGLLENEDHLFLKIKDKNDATVNAEDYLIVGDELQVFNNTSFEKLWVVGIEDQKIMLMDKDGLIVNHTNADLLSPFVLDIDNPFKVVRSGHRNLQAATMASITMMKNPINMNDDDEIDANIINFSEDNLIVNSSAIEYSDLWSPQCECLGLPDFSFKYDEETGEVNNDSPSVYAAVGFNPYRYNVKGNFRAVKSYAHLTPRTVDPDNASPRNVGFFNTYHPFYSLNAGSWDITNDDEEWTFASEVTAYSPYGVEIENKDALNRYSSALYGYNYTLPTAVSSNSEYSEIAFDNFEDYEYYPSDCVNTHFGFQEAVVETNVNISSVSAHTGHNSINVAGNSRGKLVKRIAGCDDSGTSTTPCEDCLPPSQTYTVNVSDANVVLFEVPSPCNDDYTINTSGLGAVYSNPNIIYNPMDIGTYPITVSLYEGNDEICSVEYTVIVESDGSYTTTTTPPSCNYGADVVTITISGGIPNQVINFEIFGGSGGPEVETNLSYNGISIADEIGDIGTIELDENGEAILYLYSNIDCPGGGGPASGQEHFEGGAGLILNGVIVAEISCEISCF